MGQETDFSGKLYAEDIGRSGGLLTTDRGELWNGSPYDYQQRGNATAMNISPQNLHQNSSMGGYMDSIMGGIMNSSPFMQGGGGMQMQRPRPQQQYGGLMGQRPTQQAPQESNAPPMFTMQYQAGTDEPGSEGFEPTPNPAYKKYYEESRRR